MQDKRQGSERQESETSGGDSTGIDRPRLTPQGRTDPEPSGTDETDPAGGTARSGQPDKAEG